MFRMTHDIVVTGVNKDQPFKVNSFKWNRSVENITDSATVKVPGITTLKKDGDKYKRVQTGLLFKEGMPIQIKAGYDNDNLLRFKGFIRRINYTIPVEIDCEGYAYQLRKKLDFSKSYKNTTVRAILTDLVKDTDITLSKLIPEIPLEKATFINVTGIQVLEWLKEKCLLTVYFNHEELYVGMQQLEAKATVKYRLGWNVIKDSDLKFNDQKEFADVRIQIGSRKKNGVKEKAFVGKKDGQIKKFKSLIKDKSILAKIAEAKKSEIVNRGYEGSITAFLIPYAEPGMATLIDDTKYPERTGRYFISGVSGEFGANGGRQKIKIGNTLGNG